MAVPGDADVAIFDVAGRRVRALAAGPVQAGPQSLAWDGRDGAGRAVPTGIYFVRVTVAGQSETAKIVLVR
jgi:flagellar hook assembly protein FlgD